jgi:hypothetical protein
MVCTWVVLAVLRLLFACCMYWRLLVVSRERRFVYGWLQYG